MLDLSRYYVDFSNRDNLSDTDKTNLKNIQDTYRPIERVEYLNDYRLMGKITEDDYETMTGVPYESNQ